MRHLNKTWAHISDVHLGQLANGESGLKNPETPLNLERNR